MSQNIKDDRPEPLASEMYSDLKDSTKFLQKMVVALSIVIALLVIALAGTNVYHIYLWGQFDSVVVDSGEGEGNANYIQGDNTGGIFNGQGDRPAAQEGQSGNQD